MMKVRYIVYYGITPLQGGKYIFVIISESGGGSGVFYDLHAVDKQTLRTLDSVGIGDRARIEKMVLINEPNEILSITFSTKGDADAPSEKVEKTFRINKSDLLEELDLLEDFDLLLH